MSSSFQHRFILTGGPGSGKSTIIDTIKKRGFWCSKEAGRGVIQDQVNIGGDALPWANQTAFAELMLSWEMRSWHEAEGQTRPCFFDRGVPDVVGYLRLSELTIPKHLENAIERFRYNRTVFIAPPGVTYMYRIPSASNLSMSPSRPITQWCKHTVCMTIS